MDSQRFEQLAAAIERSRRTDYWICIALVVPIAISYLYLLITRTAIQIQMEQALAAALDDQRVDAAMLAHVVQSTAFSTTALLLAPALLFLIPWAMGRYQWRRDAALVELLRAQGKSQASIQ